MGTFRSYARCVSTHVPSPGLKTSSGESGHTLEGTEGQPNFLLLHSSHRVRRPTELQAPSTLFWHCRTRTQGWKPQGTSLRFVLSESTSYLIRAEPTPNNPMAGQVALPSRNHSFSLMWSPTSLSE